MNENIDKNLKVWPSWYLFIVFSFNKDWELTPHFFSNIDEAGLFTHKRLGVSFLFFTVGFNNQWKTNTQKVGFK